MRTPLNHKRIAFFLLLFASLTFATQLPAQSAAAGPKPVKVTTAEADKLIKYRSNDNRGMAHALRLQSSVTLEYTVTTAGKVIDITPIAGDRQNAQILRLATNEVSHWQYDPYLVNGQPTPMRTTTIIKYP